MPYNICFTDFSFSGISGFILKEFQLTKGTYRMNFPHSGLTCVRYNQPPSSVTKHCSCIVGRPAGSQRDLRREEVFASSAQRCPHCNPSVVWSQAPWKCLRVGHDMVLCPLCHPYRYDERTVTLLQSNKLRSQRLDQEKRQEYGMPANSVFQFQKQCRHM